MALDVGGTAELGDCAPPKLYVRAYDKAGFGRSDRWGTKVSPIPAAEITGGFVIRHQRAWCGDSAIAPVVDVAFEDEAEAVEIANGTDFGLVASVWSENGARQMRLAKRLRAGQVFINNYGAGGGVELPFGGTGLSGHGREKGFEALYGFSSLKTVAAFHGREE